MSGGMQRLSGSCQLQVQTGKEANWEGYQVERSCLYGTCRY